MTTRLRSSSPAAKKFNSAALLFAMLVALAGCASSEGGRGSNSAGLPGILEDARRNPEGRIANEAACLDSITQGSTDFDFEAFFAGLFFVSKENGGQAFCAALIDAVIADELTEADLRAFRKPAEIRGKGPLGLMLRKLMVAHLRLSSQQAKMPPDEAAVGQ